MKSIIKCIVAAVALCAVNAMAAVLPQVGNGTEPNQWTRNMDGVLAAAKTTNLPILLVMINDSSTGEGCQHCMKLVNNTLNTENFANVVARYKFYMVLLNYWSSPSEPAYGGVSESVFDTYFYKYQAGDYGYPQVAVIRPDGTRYTGWSYETRPVSTGGNTLHQHIAEAIADLSTGETPAVVTPTQPSQPTPTEPSEEQTTGRIAITYTKPKYVLFFFNGNDDVVASAQLKITATRRWNAKITEGGRVKTLRGTVKSFKDGRLETDSSELKVVYDPKNGMWTGSASGRRVYGKSVDKADATWKGVWNVGIALSSAANLGGWASASIGFSGKITFSGKISNKIKIAGGCYSAVFPSGFVTANLPRWAGKGNVRFGHASTRTGVNVGCAFFNDDGTLGGNVSLGSQVFDVVVGSRWKKDLIAGLNGMTFRTTGAGNVAVPIVASGNKIAPGADNYGARIRCTVSKGLLSATYKVNGKTCTATGVIYAADRASVAFGGGTLGGEAFAFTIE